MRLGVLLDRYAPARGGAETHTDRLVRRALAARDEVVVATLVGEAPPGARTIRIPAPRRRPARERCFAQRGAAALRAAGCDVVLAFRHAPDCDVYLPHGGLVLDALAAKDLAAGRSPTGVRACWRALSPRTRFFLEAERTLLARPDGPVVVAVSRGLAARIADVYPACGARVVVVPCGVDAARFDPAPWREAGRTWRREAGLAGTYLGLLAAHHPLLKGLAAAVEALADERVRSLEVPFHLVVAGGGVPRRVWRRARRLGVADRVHAVGGSSDLRPLYAASDVLVHPTWHDPCSLACLEALAMEVPVVTTPGNGVREVMGSRGGIVLEAPGRPDALAVALQVLAEPALRRATAEDARRQVLRHREADALDGVLAVCRTAARR